MTRSNLGAALALILALSPRVALAQGDPPKLVPPALTKNAEPVYPEAKKAAGETATVSLSLVVDESGKVIDASVTGSAGPEFDAAALEAARRLEFAPATTDGAPVRARIAFRFTFAFEAPKVEAPREGSLEIVVRTEADAPLPGAVVEVEIAGREKLVVTTDASGLARLPSLPPGKAKVTVRAPGHEAFSADEEVRAGEAVRASYRPKPLAAPVDDGGEIRVVGERPRREVTRRTIEQREVARIPGTRGDALRALEAMPGVARPPNVTGQLIVRGSGPLDTAVFVDGTPIPIVYHFGGLTSVVPTELLAKLDFVPGNFGPEYGRVMGGVVDVGLRSPRSDGIHGVLSIDLLDARFVAEAPLSKRTRFMVAGRRSWIDAWLGPVLERSGAVGVSTAPVYYDGQAVLEHDLTRKTTVRLALFGSDDRLVFTIKSPPSSDPGIGGDLANHTRFWRLQGRSDTRVSEDVRFINTVAVGQDLTHLTLGTLDLDLRIIPLSMRSDLRAKLSSTFTAVVGLDHLVQIADVAVTAPPVPAGGPDDQTDNGPFFALPSRTRTLKTTLYQPGGYAMLETRLAPGLRILPSVRADYSSDIDEWRISPRLAARADLTSSPRTTVKGGVGLFHQPPQPYESFQPFGNPKLSSNRALHTSLGVERELGPYVELSTEVFYKRLSHLVVQLPDQTNAGSGVTYTNTGSGRIVGLEVLARWRSERLFGWIAYTLSRSERRKTDDEAFSTFQYDQTHILTALASAQVGRGWELGAKLRYVTGTPYTPAAAAVYDADAGAYSPTYGKPFTARDDAFHRLDLRVDKTWRFPSWKLGAYLDVQNVYNRRNPEGRQYNYNYARSTAVAGLPILPVLGVRGEM